MKVTDYCPRAAPFDTYLKGRGLIGVEVGVDVGAHAEALLTYCPIAFLTLVDVWPSKWVRGFCEGRLARFRHRTGYAGMGSLEAATHFRPEMLDFVYIDQEHDGPAVSADLVAWWPLVKPGGVLGYRNYTGRGTPLDKAVDGFLRGHMVGEVLDNEIVVRKPTE